MANSNSYILPSNHSPKPPPEAGSGNRTATGTPELRKLVPKLTKPKINSNKESTEETECHLLPPQEIKKRNATTTSETNKTPTKRKRSAIFIPPINTENNANPATEEAPSPAYRKRKCFPWIRAATSGTTAAQGQVHEGLRILPQGNPPAANKQHSGIIDGRIPASQRREDFSSITHRPQRWKSRLDFLLTPELPVPAFGRSQTPSQELNSQRIKKRKSRKSLQREKLEQTFKEKGTEQTESAEGATYCKFRQLRKFTRYLFRSWKDYLPGNLAEGETPRVAIGDNSELNVNELLHENSDNISVHSGSEMSSSNAQQ
ncbi:hypothetical protein NQ317_003540 [Molorchus minor]|uniref:Uncharacterized protein n=1 Tax=Molorchus minor TaxID=1323400 RepID=A0ABQ9K192_9CUCU|nr:hypothetical protein NQ317_003540 [Molorchus minor]